MKIREIFTEKIKELSNKYNLEPYEVYYYLGSQIDFYSHDGEYYIKINRRLVVGNPYTIGVLSLLKMLYDKENKVMSLNKLFKKMDIEPVDLNFFCEKLRKRVN